MQKNGCAIIGFAVFLIFAFVADQFIFRDKSGLDVEAVVPDEPFDQPDPAELDPALYAPSIADDIGDTRFDLNADELKMASEGADYTYTIQEGDDIDTLARKYLGRHELKSFLFEYNPDLARGAALETGTKITIPFRHRLQ